MKRRGQLSARYLEKKNLGGLFGKIGKLNSSQVTAGAGFLGSAVDALDPGDDYGVQSDGGALIKGAASGAAAGSAIMPGPGTAIGAVGGAILSALGNSKRKKAKEQDIIRKNKDLNRKMDAEVVARIGEDTRVLGDGSATMYKLGGTLKGKPAGKFSLQGASLLGKYRSDSLLPSITVNPNKMMAKGGVIPTDATGRAVVVGPDHEDGGVKLPEAGVELEGGETLDNNFVFSKELGFADKHKKIIKAASKLEKDPSSLARYTEKLLEVKEENLKVQQEQTKAEMGLDNEITGGSLSSNYKMQNGGRIKTFGGGSVQFAPKKNKGTNLNEPVKIVSPVVPIHHLPSTQQSTIATPVVTNTTGLGNGGMRRSPSRKNTALANPTVESPSLAKSYLEQGKEAGVKPQLYASDLNAPINGQKVAGLDKQANATVPGTVTPATTSTKVEGNNKDGLGSKFEDIMPFASNLINSFRKLPKVPDPILTDAIAPTYMNMQASRNEAVRAVRGANQAAAQSLASSTATQAVAAANLTQGIRAVNEVNQAENNANAQISNQTKEANRQIERENNAKLEYNATQKVSRSLKQQELNSENLANFSDKMQLRQRDRNLRSLEDDKLMLAIAQDDTGASWRSGKHVFQRRLTPESYKELEAKMTELEKMSKKERELQQEGIMASILALTGNKDIKSTLVTPNKKK